METAVDHATDRTLTEGANAAGIGEGNHPKRCDPEPVHIGPGQHLIGCPFGHRCQLNELIDKVNRWETLLMEAMDKDCPDVDDIDWLTDRVTRYRERMEAQLAPHTELWAKHDQARVHQRNIEKQHKGAWAFTLTYSPAKTGWDKEEAMATMREAIRRLRHYYRHEIEEFEAVGELTQAGLPHVHGLYRLTGGKRMTTKNFKRAYPIWDPKSRMGSGHVGGYHQPAKSDSDYSGYIQKDLDDAWLVESTTNAVQTSGPEEARDEVQAPDDTPPDSPHPAG